MFGALVVRDFLQAPYLVGEGAWAESRIHVAYLDHYRMMIGPQAILVDCHDLDER